MRCNLFLVLLVVLLFGLTTTTSVAVTLNADGYATDNSTGFSGPVPLDGYIDFTVISASSTQQDSAFDGSAAKPIGTVRDLLIELIKFLADLPCSADPEPDGSGEPPTLAAITNETYQGVFTVVAPDFQAFGTYFRTPALFDFDYELTVGVNFPDLTGLYSFETVTLPNGLGAADQFSIVNAETVVGDFYEFTQFTSLTFDPTVELSMPQHSLGSETIEIIGDNVVYAGTVQVTMIPEPSSIVLLMAMFGGFFIYSWRHCKTKVNLILTIILVLTISPLTANASSIALSANGQIIETGSGATGWATLDGSVDYSTIGTSSNSQSDSFSGSATQDMEITLRELYARAWLAVKNFLNTEISTSPPPASGGPDTLAALTGETFEGSFIATTPDFEFSGTFLRTPAEMAIDYNLILNPSCPDLTGYYTFEAYTMPAGPGTALRTIEVNAEMVGGSIYTFTHNTMLSFDPSIELLTPEMAVGEEMVIRDEDLFSFSGNTQVIVPEPSTLVLLSLGFASLLAYASCRRR